MSRPERGAMSARARLRDWALGGTWWAVLVSRGGAGMVGGVEGEGDLPFFTFAASTSFWSWRLALVRSSSGGWE